MHDSSSIAAVLILLSAWRCLAEGPALGALPESGHPAVNPAPAPAPQAATPVPTSDPGNTGNWTLNPAFSDNFDAGTLDTTKWQLKGIGWDGRQPSFFLPANVTVGGGNLQLTMRRDPNNATIPRWAQQQGYNGYTAAEVNSIAPAPYGYYEARIKAMNSSGSTAFWLAGSRGQYKIEIDVVEITAKLNGGTGPANDVFMSAHLWAAPGMPDNGTDYAPNVGIDPTTDWSGGWNAAADYHIYGLDWNAKTITWYVDGVQRRQIENTDWTVPVPIIFDTEIFTGWFGLPADSDLPSTIYVDYVRAWTKGSGPVLKTPVITPRIGVSVPVGTPLSNLATDDVPGTFTYSPAVAQQAGPLQVTANFIPADTGSYTTASATVSITVKKRRRP